MPGDIAAVRSSSRFALREPYAIGLSVSLTCSRGAGAILFFLVDFAFRLSAGMDWVLSLACSRGAWVKLLLSPSAKDKLRFVVGLPSCRAGSYFRYAAKVTKGAPRREKKTVRAVFFSPLGFPLIFRPIAVRLRAAPGGLLQGRRKACSRGVGALKSVYARAA